MTEKLQLKCELFERNHTAISNKFPFEKALMSLAAGLIFTGADKEADVEVLKLCRSTLDKHTGLFSEYKSAVKLALLSEMALSGDAEQYLADVKTVYQKLHKGKLVDNSYMILAAMMLCDLGRQNDADTVIERHNEIMARMEKAHPFLTCSEDISYVILLALSDRSVDAILGDLDACMDYFKNTSKIKADADAVQELSELLALTDGDIREKCDKAIALYDALNAATDKEIVLSMTGMLIYIDETPETIISEILAADEYLKEHKIFGKEAEDKKRRLMFAELLVADTYGTGSTIVNNSFINSALGIIKAQQIAAMITVISNVLPAILGAVSGQDSEDHGEEAGQEQTASE